MPELFKDNDTRLALARSIYGLKNSSMLFGKMMEKALKDLGFKQSENDKCVFMRAKDKTGKLLPGYDINENRDDVDVVALCAYVDDLGGFASSKQVWDDTITELGSVFKIKNEGRLDTFIGIECNHHDDGSISLSHKSKIEKIVAACEGKLPARTSSTPLPEGTLFPKVPDDAPPMSAEDQALVDSVDYRSIVGALLHITVMVRADIAFGLSQLCRHVTEPRAEHVRALLHMVSYLRATKDHGPKYTRGTERKVHVYVDASFAECVDTRRSTSGWVVMVNGCAVAWSSKRQATVSLSSTESELEALRQVLAEVIALKADLALLDPMLARSKWIVHEDNNAARLIVEGGGSVCARKHICVKAHWLREVWMNGLFELVYVNTADQTADTLTKSLSGPLVEKHRDAMFNVHGSGRARRCTLVQDWLQFTVAEK